MISRRFSCLLCIFVLRGAIETANGYNMTVVTKAMTMGESPVWDDETNTLILVDIIDKKIIRYDPAHPEDLKYVRLYGGRVTPAVPIEGTNCTSLLVGSGRALRLIKVDWGGVGEQATLISSKILAVVDTDLPGNRYNDGKADYKGRLWIGTMDDGNTARRRREISESARGRVYRFDLKGDRGGSHIVKTTEVLTDMYIPNGMVWTPGKNDNDRTYYLADSKTSVVYSYKFFGASGSLGSQEVAFNFTANNVPGVPDGLTLDKDGNLWIACVHGALVIQVNPGTGKVLQAIPMPVKSVTCVEWGGPERDVLYVTTSKYKSSEAYLKKHPDAGKMFTITGLGTRGYKELPYVVHQRLTATAGVSKICTTLFGSLLAAFAHITITVATNP